ncbi:MAG: acyltransferase family protein [Actinomycetia bacterium]|nr:acyltransferase family protein [Actinomycetes bacterium]
MAKRIAWLDIAKGITIILVIFGHTFAPGMLTREVIFSFHMPLFFILAGYTFKVRPTAEQAKKAVPQLLAPFLLTFLVCQVILNAVGQEQLGAAFLMQLIKAMVWTTGYTYAPLDVPAVGMIWFLACLFLSRIVFNLLLGGLERQNCPEWLRALIFVAVAACGVVIGSTMNIYLPFCLDLVMVAQLFLYLGWLAKRYDFPRFLTKAWCILTCLVIWVLAICFSHIELATRSYSEAAAPLAFAGAIAGTCLCCWLAIVIERYLSFLIPPLLFLGQTTLFILCIHAIEGNLIDWMASPLLADAPAPYLLASIIRTVFILAIAWLAHVTLPKTMPQPQAKTGKDI